ncbi:hypothetical protein LT232_01355 [Bacillus velezensis]|nr:MULTISPECIES: hypothetical protein [Bacillus amyloliquefaciens group]UGW84804.1 hypothetical protein LT232_01355 [Bacillus velezensis]
MGFLIQFFIGGTVMVAAAYLSKSKYLFLSGVITLLPIMTLLNIHLQLKKYERRRFQSRSKKRNIRCLRRSDLHQQYFHPDKLVQRWPRSHRCVSHLYLLYDRL